MLCMLWRGWTASWIVWPRADGPEGTRSRASSGDVPRTITVKTAGIMRDKLPPPLASPGEKISWAGQGVFISGENIASHAVSKTRTTDADDS